MTCKESSETLNYKWPINKVLLLPFKHAYKLKHTHRPVHPSEGSFWLFGKLIGSDKHSCSKSLFSSHCKSIKLMRRAGFSGWYQLPVQGLTSCRLARKSGNNCGADATLKQKPVLKHRHTGRLPILVQRVLVIRRTSIKWQICMSAETLPEGFLCIQHLPLTVLW